MLNYLKETAHQKVDMFEKTDVCTQTIYQNRLRNKKVIHNEISIIAFYSSHFEYIMSLISKPVDL